MGQLIWQLKQLLNKAIVFAVIGGICYGGYSLYRQGAFRGGIAHAGKVILRQVPYFGSRFRHYLTSGKRGQSNRGSISYRSQSRRSKWSKGKRRHSQAYRRNHRSRR